MSHQRRHDSQVHVTSRKRDADLERTTVDVNPLLRREHAASAAAALAAASAADASASRIPPSVMAHARSNNEMSPRPIARGTTPPPQNVIPFTKPRAIAAIAAAHPGSVVVKDERRVAPVEPVAPVSTWNQPPASRVASRRTPQHGYPAQAPATFAEAAAPMPVAAPPVFVAPAPVPAPAPAPAPPPFVPAFGPDATTPDVLAAKPKQPWAEYEQLGLGAPKPHVSPTASPRQQQIAKTLVSAYRLLGFLILTIIVVVLVGYIATTAFFYMSSSWIVPMAVSPTDEKVVTLQAQLADLQTQRDRLADEMRDSERSIAAQQAFQGEFAKAIKGDLEGRKAALGRVRALAEAAAATRAQIRNQNTAYASSSRRKMSDEYEAGLIDRNTMLAGKFQLAQITNNNLTLQERQAEFETQAADLEDQTRSLDAILDSASASDEDGGEDAALSYEVLKIKQELEASRMDLAKALQTRETIKTALARQDKMIDAFKQSPYLRAVEDGAQIAFVPYNNLGHATKGEELYACKLGMLVCFKVGEILDVLPGEVQGKHPNRDKMLRGQLVELKLDASDLDAASRDVLFAGGRPVLF